MCRFALHQHACGHPAALPFKTRLCDPSSPARSSLCNYSPQPLHIIALPSHCYKCAGESRRWARIPHCASFRDERALRIWARGKDRANVRWVVDEVEDRMEDEWKIRGMWVNTEGGDKGEGEAGRRIDEALVSPKTIASSGQGGILDQ